MQFGLKINLPSPSVMLKWVFNFFVELGGGEDDVLVWCLDGASTSLASDDVAV